MAQKRVDVIPEGTKITLPSSCKADENSSKEYKHELIFDFSGVAIPQVCIGYARSERINWQRKFRSHLKSGKMLAPEGGVKIKVADLLSGIRTQVEPTVEGVAAAAETNATLRDELIERLMAMREAEKAEPETD